MKKWTDFHIYFFFISTGPQEEQRSRQGRQRQEAETAWAPPRAAEEARTARDWQGREQDNCPGHVQAELSRSPYFRGMVSVSPHAAPFRSFSEIRFPPISSTGAKSSTSQSRRSSTKRNGTSSGGPSTWPMRTTYFKLVNGSESGIPQLWDIVWGSLPECP